MKYWNLFLSLLLCYSLNAQNIKEKYKLADEYWHKYHSKYYNGDITPHWIGDTHFFWYRTTDAGGTTFILADADKKTKQPAFNHQALAQALATATAQETDARHLPFGEITFTGDLDAISFSWKGVVYTYSRKKNKITGRKPEEPRRGNGYWGGVDQENRKGSTLSPDRKKEAYINEGNLFVKDLESGKVTRLSQDGSPGEYYSSRIYWSPDSRQIACCKYRPAWVRKLRTVVSSPQDRLQPGMEERDYIKPGDALPIKKPVLFIVSEGRQIAIDFPGAEDQFSVGNIRWSPDSEYFTFDYNKRGHQEYIVYKASGHTPQAQVLIKEQMPTFIHYGRLYRHDLQKQKEILWISERDGWRHLYLYDAGRGLVKRQLTQGEWIVKNVLHVDESTRTLYFTGCGKTPGEDPYLEKLYSLNIDSRKIKCLTPENGNHRITFSPDYSYFTDCWSRVDCPPVIVVKNTADGSIRMPLEKADISKMLAEGWRMPEVFCAKGRDNETDIWGVIVRPTDFDPHKKYPVIEYIYAGPHDSFVPKSFSISPVDAALAQLGFIVVQIDGMGTANRSKKFHDICWKNLKDAGFPDRIAWLKAAAAKYPEIDISRVGIYGCSAGGQNALGAVLFHPDFYKASVAACGCHDNRMDKIWWNEQWMGFPVGKEYEECSNVTNAHKLKGRLMLILGELDDNVDPSSTLQVVNALIRANKEFEFVMLPNQRHTMGGTYGERKRRDFFIKHLQGLNPPDWNMD